MHSNSKLTKCLLLALVSSTAMTGTAAIAATAAKGPYAAIFGGYFGENNYSLDGLGSTANSADSTDATKNNSAMTQSSNAQVDFGGKGGILGGVAIGYHLGDGIRSEFEVSYRSINSTDSGTTWFGADNAGTSASPTDSQGLSKTALNTAEALTTCTTATGCTPYSYSSEDQSLAMMVNGYYDFDTGSAVTPYVGLGVGAARTSHTDSTDNITSRQWNFAYQGIVGASYAVNDQMSVSLDYRYFATAKPTYDSTFGQNGIATTGAVSNAVPATYAINSGDGQYSGKGKYVTNNLVIGLIFNFEAPAPAPVVEAIAAPPTSPAADILARSYLVFFDWNKSEITMEAETIIKDAFNAAKAGNFVRINLTGYTDKSGAPSYNERLSLERAMAVKKKLLELGMKASEITTVGKGESDPLVPTPDGVREAQNRRVEIIIE